MSHTRLESNLALVTPSARLESERLDLLRAIRDCGTLMEASKLLRISYKTACTWLESLNNASDAPLLVSNHGGHNRGSTQLTPFGHAILDRYDRMHAIHQHLQAELEVMDRLQHDDLHGFLVRLKLRTSARNHLHGRVEDIVGDRVRSMVWVRVSPTLLIASLVSTRAVAEMELSIGVIITLLCKATAVHLSPIDRVELSEENCWECPILRTLCDGDSCEVILDLDSQHSLSAMVALSEWSHICTISAQRVRVHLPPSHIVILRME